MTVALRPPPGLSRDYQFPKFFRHSLANGLQLIVAPVRKLPVVSVMVVVDATALDDPLGKEGTAQLTAEALREGTLVRDGLHVTLDLEKLGTSLETGADWDSTIASMTVLTDRLGPAFRILAEVLTSPIFPEEEIQRLKAERLAERMQLLEEPRGLADESFARFLYAPGNRYAEPISGGSTSVSAISRDDVTAFYQRNYVPESSTLILAGDITAEDAIQLAESTLGEWRGRRDRLVHLPDQPSRISRAVKIVAKPDAAQSEIRIGHAGVPRSHPDYFRIVVMNAVLGGLFSSRINLNLREVHGYTYGASSSYDWRRHSGPFVIATAVQSEVTGEAIIETFREIDRMRTEEISDDERTLAASYLEGVFPIRYETTSAIASALANLVIFDLPENYYDTYRASITAVTTGNILDAARTHVRAGELQVVVVGNPKLVCGPVEALSIGPMDVQVPDGL